MRVLHVAQPTEAGVAVCVRSYAEDQVRRGWDITVACPSGDHHLAGWVERAGARHEPWEASRHPGPSTLLETSRLGRIWRRAEPHIVHLHSSKAGLAGRMALRGRSPTVFQPHAWSFQALHGPLSGAALTWERSAARWTDTTICVSEGEKELARESGISQRCVVVENGVDPDRWPHRTYEERGEARQRLGIPDLPTVVCVGRLSEQKGQDVLVRSWRNVLSARPDARLYLVGDGPTRAAVESSAGAGIELVGGRDDVSTWLTASDIVALPSRWEGMSLALLEAMATGRSVVATDVPGVQETVAGAGAVVPPGDERALAAEIVSRLSDPSRTRREGQLARERVVEHFPLRRSLDRIAAIYAETVARHPSTAEAAR